MTSPSILAEDAWKPCDLRGRYPDAVSPDLFHSIGGAIGTMLSPSARVVVAGDFRLSTPELKSALIDGLMHSGVCVLDAGQGPTPLAYFAAQRLEADAVLIVTASHNPPEDNGLKLMLGSVPTHPQQLLEIRRLAESRAFRLGRGSMKCVDPRQLYMRTMLERWESLRQGEPGRVVLDAGNGAWSEMAPTIFRSLSFSATCISCVVDGTFPDRPSDCASASNLSRLSSVVREQRNAIGVAWDGDGDRVAFVDEAGRYVSPDEIAILFVRALLCQEESQRIANRKIVVDVKCSDIVRRSILQHGGTPLLERTGHAFMRSCMVAQEALLGLDACGHYFYRELHGGDDGLFAALMLLSLVRASGCTLAELRRSLPPIFGTPEIRIPSAALSYVEASAALRSAFPNARVEHLDGLRFVMVDGIVLLRQSGTEPVLSLRIEGFDGESYEHILAQCLECLPQAAPQLRSATIEAGELISISPSNRSLEIREMTTSSIPFIDTAPDSPEAAAQQHRRRPLGLEPDIDPTARVRDSVLGSYTSVGPHTSMNASTFGDYSYVVQNCSIVWADIGKFCSIAADTRINPGNHPMWRAALHHFTYRSKSYGFSVDDDSEFFEWRASHRVTLGNDVWIGHASTILPGVKIGTGAGIGAGAVVSKDVPPFAIYGGVPAKLIRFRFPEKVQEDLMNLAWWNWPREKLEIALPDFRKLSAEEFVEKYAEYCWPA